MKHQAHLSQTREFIYEHIKIKANARALEWLEQQQDNIQENPENLQSFYLAFSMASRFFNKEDLELSEKSISEAERLRKGFQPSYWNLLQAARTFLLLLLPYEDAEFYHASLNKLFETADIEEQIALYAALPLLPDPNHLTHRATEGIRTNITSVFDAIALRNPYPADFLNKDAWNQMVLKAVFMQRPLYQIYGADKRANNDLARMLIDFAHERWSAGRKITPELWRFVCPYINENFLPDIKKTLTEGDALEREACLLACSLSPSPMAKQLVDKFPGLRLKINDPVKGWQEIGERSFLN
jgi:hypothetical protein